MTITKDFLLEALLRHNYLPTMRRSREEIPPFISSVSFSPDAARALAKLNYRKGAYTGYDQINYRLTRFNNVSRLLSIPHPLPHAKLCLALHENWEKFQFIAANPQSQIKPQAYSDGRVIIMNGYSDSVDKANRQLTSAFGKRYLVKTDIANCFPSIYTHAVPWALVGFEESKAKKSSEHANEWFNQIDTHLRFCRRNETQGVAIGPATSNLIAEIILSKIDEKLCEYQFDFVRYIDDYTCHFETEEDARKFVRVIEQEVGKYKLQLNAKKTEIKSLPCPISEPWVIELSERLPISETVSAFDAFRFLDFAVALAKRHPEGSVLKYAASAIGGKTFEYGAGDKVLNYLLSLAHHQPTLLPVITSLVDQGYFLFVGAAFDLYGSTDKLNCIVQENALLHRSDGMCWSLYHLGRLDAVISEKTAHDVISTRDPLAILTLYWSSDTYKESCVSFCESLSADDLYELDRYWLLLYQLWCDDRIKNPYKNDQVFKTLKSFDVNFLLQRDQFMPKDDKTEGRDANVPVKNVG